MSDRYVLIGLARSRQGWFAELARWSTAAVAPIDYLKCLDPDEVRVLFGSGRRISALLLDAGSAGVDRELFALASSSGAAVFVVDDGRTRRDWESLGAAAVLPEHFERGELMEALTRHARTVDRSSRSAGRAVVDPAGRTSGDARLVSVAGAAGAGTSMVAMAIAQNLAAALGPRSFAAGAPMRVALVDGTRRASAAMYHDVGDVLPGLPELVEAHRHDELDPDAVRRLSLSERERGYDLLLGDADPGISQRCGQHARRPDALRRATTSWSSSTIPTSMARTRPAPSTSRSSTVWCAERRQLADLVVAVGRPGMWGLHRHVRLLEEPTTPDSIRGRGPTGGQPRPTHTRSTGAAHPHTRSAHRARRARSAGHCRCSSPTTDTSPTASAAQSRCHSGGVGRWPARCPRSLCSSPTSTFPVGPTGPPAVPLVPGELGTDPVRPREVA